MKNTMKYSLRYGVKTLLAGVLLFSATSCHKDPVEPTPQPDNKKHNVEIKINGNAGGGNDTTGFVYQLREELLAQYQGNPKVDTVLIIPYGDWSWLRGPNQNFVINSMKYIRSNYPKTWGRGDFNFYPGDLSVEDSLWFVGNGWTINKDLQR